MIEYLRLTEPFLRLEEINLIPMFKNYSLNQKFSIGTAIVLSMLFIYSCRKEYIQNAERAQQNELSAWYSANLKVSEDNPFSRMRPDWDSVYSQDIGGQTVYEISLENVDGFLLTARNRSRGNVKEEEKMHENKLLIFKNRSTGKIIYGAFMSFEASERLNKEKLHYKNVGKASGTLLFHHFNGNLANGWVYEDGQVKKEVTVSSMEEYLQSNKGSNGKVMGYECGPTFVDYYRWASVAGVWGWHFFKTEVITTCKWKDELPSTEDEDTGNPPPDEPGGDYHPPIYIDCNGDANGTASWSYECDTCIGGNTGISECVAPDLIVTDSLKINFPCLSEWVLKKLKMDTAFQKLLGPFTPMSGERPNLKYTYSAQTYGSGGAYQLGHTGTNGWSSTVSFNSVSLTNSSELFIAMAAIHETGHAYANYYIKSGYYGRPVTGSSWAINIADYELANRESMNYSNAMDHSIFLEQYFDKMVSVIAAYGGSNYSIEQYRMAALFGLDNPGPPPTDPTLLARYNQLATALSNSYNRIISKYNINLNTLNNFKLDNLVNVPTSLKLPTSCP